MSGMKHQNITLLSDANVPVRFRAQKRAKYSSPQLTANYIAAERCSGTVSKIFTVTNAPFTLKLESNGLQIHRNCNFSQRTFSTSAIFKAASKLFGSQSCSDDKNWLDFSNISLYTCRFRSSTMLSRGAMLESTLTVAWFSWGFFMTCVLTTFWRHLGSITEQTHGNRNLFVNMIKKQTTSDKAFLVQNLTTYFEYRPTLVNTNKAIWRSLLSIQNEAISLVAMRLWWTLEAIRFEFLNEWSVRDGVNLFPLWLEILKLYWYSVGDTIYTI